MRRNKGDGWCIDLFGHHLQLFHNRPSLSFKLWLGNDYLLLLGR
jgi:hypothetical protein